MDLNDHINLQLKKRIPDLKYEVYQKSLDNDSYAYEYYIIDISTGKRIGMPLPCRITVMYTVEWLHSVNVVFT